jgi:hypothetical protein
MKRQPAVRWGIPCPAFGRTTRVFAAVLLLTWGERARAQPAFNYTPIGGPILNASLSINFAGLTANRFVGTTEVNHLQLWAPSGVTSLDLSTALFGNSPWPSPPLVNQGPSQTGFVSANISPSFFPILQSGQVGLTALFTDTGDGWFAIDTIELNITTSSGTITSWYGSAPDGFGLGIPPGGNLPGPLPGSLGFTGTGFDEAISSKYISVIPEPGACAVLGLGVALLLRRGRRRHKLNGVAARMLVAAGFLATAATLPAQPLTRAQAAAALLGNVSVDTSQQNVWSPYVDYGYGAGREGLLPAGSAVVPYIADLPFPGMTNTSPSYFFFIDDLLGANYAHPTRFALVDAFNPAPVLGSGIVVTGQEWWPVVMPFGFPPAEFFNADASSAYPPGPGNPDGLIAGGAPPPAPAPPGPGLPSPGPPPPAGPAATNACALVLNGSGEVHRACTISNYFYDLTNHYGVPTNRIVVANRGNAASSNDLYNAITTILNSRPPCDKIFVRMISHGNTNAGGYYIVLAGQRVYATNLCAMLKRLADQGVPICLVMDTCFSGASLQSNNWNFPAGSVVVTSADGNHSSFGQRSYLDGTNIFCGDLFPYAFSQCLNANPTNRINGQRLDGNGDGFVDDAEAYRWVTNVQPCYTWNTPARLMRYPGSRGTNDNRPGPQMRQVGTDGRMVNINVCNATGTNKTDFHMIFQGNVTNGTMGAWRSTVNDRISTNWAVGRTNRTITYDTNRNETMVCWTDTNNPVLPNQYIHFGYWPPAGKTLRPRRQYWTPTTNTPPATPDRVPTPRPKVLWDTNTAYVSIEVLNDSTDDGGWGATLSLNSQVYYASDLIPLAQLNLGNPAVSNLPLVYATNYTLPSGGALDFTTPLPISPGDPNPTVVFVSQASWNVNGNVAVSLQELPCNILRNVVVFPDQLHLYGPNPNTFAAGTPQSLTAMVENSFLGLPDMTVNFSAPVGSIQFTSGALGAGGTSSSVTTDPFGTATVSFVGTAPGAALLQATVNGLNAYEFTQVLPAGPNPAMSIASGGNAALSLTILGQPNQAYDIQRSTDLHNWSTIATMNASDLGVVQFTDPAPPPERAFYRTIVR